MEKQYVIERVRGDFDPAVFVEKIKDCAIDLEWKERYNQLKPWFDQIMYAKTIPMEMIDSVDNELMEWLEDAIHHGKDFMGASEYSKENFFYQYLRSRETISNIKEAREKPTPELFF